MQIVGEEASVEEAHVEKAAAEEARKYFVFGAPFIRGTCILGVIAIHVASKGNPLVWSGWLSPVSFAVPVFVLLSGFSLSLNTRNETRPVGFYRRTLKFLVVAYVFYTLLYTGLGIAQTTPMLKLVLFYSVSGHLWFMPAIIGLYLLHPWLRRLYRISPYGTCVAAFVLQLFVRPWAKAHGLDGDFATVLLSFSSLIGFFVAGYLLSDRARTVRRLCAHPAGPYLAAVVWLAYPAITYAGGTGSAIAGRMLGAGSALAAFCVMASLSQPLSAMGRSIARRVAPFGLYSYGIYLLHPIVLDQVSRAVMYTGLRNATAVWYVLVFSLTGPAALLVTRRLAILPGGRYIT